MKVFEDNESARRRLNLLAVRDPEQRHQIQLQAAQRIEDPFRRNMALAQVYAAKGERDKTLAHLKEAEKLQPDNPALLENLFNFHLSQEQYDQAEQYAESAAQADIDGVGGKYYQAKLAFARERYAEAVELLKSAVRERPTFPEAWILLGRCQLALDPPAHEDAKASFEIAHRQNSSSRAALLGLVIACRELDEQGNYSKYLQMAYQLDPGHPQIREEYLRLMEDQTGPEAVERLIRIREAAMNRPESDSYANRVKLARLYETQGQLSKAERLLRSLASRSNATHADMQRLLEFLRRSGRDSEARSLLPEYVAQASDKSAAYLVWAGYLETAQQAEQARTAYNRALEAAPDEPEVHLSIARFHGRIGEWGEAADRAARHVELLGQKAGPEDYQRLIEFRINAEQFDQASELIARRLEASPNDAALLAMKGLLAHRQGRNEDALRWFQRSLDAEDEQTRALTWRAQLYLDQGQVGKAEEDLERARMIEPTPTVVRRLVRIYDNQDEFLKARAVLESYLAQNPNDINLQRMNLALCRRHERYSLMQDSLAAAKKVMPRAPFLLTEEARMWLAVEQPNRALSALDELAAVQRDDPQGDLLRMRALHSVGRYQDVIRLGQRREKDPQVGVRALALMGVTYRAMGKETEADRMFRKAVGLAAREEDLFFVVSQLRRAHPSGEVAARLEQWLGDRPDDWQLPYLLGNVHISSREAKKATAAYQKALGRTEPKSSERATVLRSLALHLATQGEHQRSAKAYEEALAIEPGSANTLNNYAWMLATDLGRLDEALEYSRKAVELLPNNASVLDTYGYILLLKGDLDEAARQLFRATQQGQSAAAHLHYGQTLEKLEQVDSAIAQYRKGWALVEDDPDNPNHEPLREALTRLGETP
jgi:tetratricopeptide (TPR) repeat protein